MPCDQITFVDNQVCLDLLELRPISVLAMLDEEVKVAAGSDETYTNKLHRIFFDEAKHAHYIRNPKNPMSFGIRCVSTNIAAMH